MGMNWKKENIVKFKYYATAFLLPIVVLLFIYTLTDISPLGSNTLLTSDMKNQYISFFSYFRGFLHGENSLFYSFSQGLGGEMIGLTAYYLLSPFNLLLYFADVSNLPTFILIITLLKLGLSGFTMYLYLSKKRANLFSLVGALAYALMSYNMVYHHNIMWLDSIVFLPLIIMGLDNIIEGKKSYVYLIFLTATIISQYYIAFMVCIFIVLYYTLKLIEHNWNGDLKEFFSASSKSMLYFVIESLLAGVISSFMIVPLFFSFAAGASEGKMRMEELFSLQGLFNPESILSKFYIGSYSIEEMKTGLPNIYTSLVTVPGFILYFLSSKNNRKNKVIASLFILVMLFSFNIEGLNILWHGITIPAWFPFRYSFLFTFLIIVYSTAGLDNFYKDTELKSKSKLVFTITTFVFLITTFRVYTINYEFIENHLLVVSLVIFGLYMILLHKLTLKRNKALSSILILLMMIELTVNGTATLGVMDHAPSEKYTEMVSNIENTLALIPEDTPYRLEKTYAFNQNDPFLFNYAGVNHFSSNAKMQDKAFLEKLGYRNHDNFWINFDDGSTTQADSLLSVRYILSGENHPRYTYRETYEDIRIYENEYALPLVYLVDSSYLPSTLEYTENPVYFVSQIYNRLGSPESIFDRIEDTAITVELENVKVVTQDAGYHYVRDNPAEEAFIHYSMDNPSGNPIHYYFKTNRLDGATVSVDGEEIGIAFDLYHHTVDTAVSDEETVRISLQLQADKLEYREHYFYYEQTEVYESIVNDLQNNGMTINEFNDGYLHAEIENTQNLTHAILSIPYDENWEIVINGEKVKQQLVFEGLMKVELPSVPSLTLEMKYVPRGVKLGAVLSIVGVIISVIFISWDGPTKTHRSD